MARTLDEILTTEMPDVVTQAREKADLMRLEIHLTQLREMLALKDKRKIASREQKISNIKAGIFTTKRNKN